jgi:hypothetical protein
MEALRQRIDKERSKAEKRHRKIGLFALLGGGFFILGIAVTLAFGASIVPLQDSSLLLWIGLFSGVLGMAILIVCMFSYNYSSPYTSRGRFKKGDAMTVGEAMKMHVYYPWWMRDWTYGWIPLTPFAVLIILGAVNILPISVAWLFFFVYGGAMMIYQYLYARRWVSKQQKDAV